MKRFVICSFIFLILSLTLISAFSFSDVWDKISGKVIESSGDFEGTRQIVLGEDYNTYVDTNYFTQATVEFLHFDSEDVGKIFELVTDTDNQVVAIELYERHVDLGEIWWLDGVNILDSDRTNNPFLTFEIYHEGDYSLVYITRPNEDGVEENLEIQRTISLNENEFPADYSKTVIVDFSNMPSETISTLDDPLEFSNQLNLAYNAMKDLTGKDTSFLDTFGKLKFRFETINYCGLAGNPVLYNPADFCFNVGAINEGDPGWGPIHEMGHDFTLSYSLVWKGESSEMWANFMALYVYDIGLFPKIGKLSQTEYWENVCGTNNPQGDVLHCLFLTLKEKYGWEIVKIFFEKYNNDDSGLNEDAEEQKKLSVRYLAESLFSLTKDIKDYNRVIDYLVKRGFPDPAQPYCQQKGRTIGWYHFNFRGDEDLIAGYSGDCRGCEAVCLNGGTDEEGWYSSCGGDLILLGRCEINVYSEGIPEEDSVYGCVDNDANSDNPLYLKGQTEGQKAWTGWYVWDDDLGVKWVEPEKTSGEDVCIETGEYSGMLKEYECWEGRVVEMYYECENGCLDGVCLSESGSENPIENVCVDSDGGKNYFVKGNVISILEDGGKSLGYDLCHTGGENEGFLQEVYCDGDVLGFEDYECANGCLNGACIADENLSYSFLLIYDSEVNSASDKIILSNLGGHLSSEFSLGYTLLGNRGLTEKSFLEKVVIFISNGKIVFVNDDFISSLEMNEIIDEVVSFLSSGSYDIAFCEDVLKLSEVEDYTLISYLCDLDSRDLFSRDTQCTDSCFFEGKCYPLGYRIEKLFCSNDGNFKFQKEEEEFCENNFECGSNVCVNGKCLSGTFIQNLIEWLKKFFNIV